MNLHTHHRPSDPAEQFILNCYPGAVPADVERCSVGLHPWHVDAIWQQQLELLRQDLRLPNVVAIGECGLDMVKGPELSLQQAAFSNCGLYMVFVVSLSWLSNFSLVAYVFRLVFISTLPHSNWFASRAFHFIVKPMMKWG